MVAYPYCTILVIIKRDEFVEFRAHLDTGSGIEDTGEWVRDEVVLARVRVNPNPK